MESSSVGLLYRVTCFVLAVFWTTHALEKLNFINGWDLGKARTEQIAHVIEDGFGWGAWGVVPVLLLFFCVQGTAAGCAWMALFKGIKSPWMTRSIAAAIVFFGIAFVGDIASASRPYVVKHAWWSAGFLALGIGWQVLRSIHDLLDAQHASVAISTHDTESERSSNEALVRVDFDNECIGWSGGAGASGGVAGRIRVIAGEAKALENQSINGVYATKSEKGNQGGRRSMHV